MGKRSLILTSIEEFFEKEELQALCANVAPYKCTPELTQCHKPLVVSRRGFIIEVLCFQLAKFIEAGCRRDILGVSLGEFLAIGNRFPERGLDGFRLHCVDSLAISSKSDVVLLLIG